MQAEAKIEPREFPLHQFNKPYWQWNKVTAILKTRIEGKSAKVPLKSTIGFTDPDDKSQ